MSVPTARSISYPALAMGLLLFLGGTLGAWAWFHVNPAVPAQSLEFAARPTLPGTRFVPQPVSEQQMEILANTNLFNGYFIEADSGRHFTVFFADWRARSAREMNVVQHTPDVCWVGGGWVPIDVGLPSKVDLTFGGQRIPFECRAFQAGQGTRRELTLWCTLVSGQVFSEGERFGSERDLSQETRVRASMANRRRGFEQFSKVVRERIAGDGSKQFVRFSIALEGTQSDRTLESLRRFGETWLELKVDRKNLAASPGH